MRRVHVQLSYTFLPAFIAVLAITASLSLFSYIVLYQHSQILNTKQFEATVNKFDALPQTEINYSKYSLYNHLAEYILVLGTLLSIILYYFFALLQKKLNVHILQLINDESTAIKNDEQRLRLLLNAGPDIIALKDRRGRLLEANDAYLELFNIKDKDYRNKTNKQLANLTHPRYWSSLITSSSTDSDVWKQKKTYRGEETFPTHDGETHVYEMIKTLICETHSEDNKLVVFGRNVTNRQKREEKLKRQEILFSEAQRISKLGSWEWNIISNELSWSKETFRIFGVTNRDKMLSLEDFISVVHPDDQLKVNSSIEAALYNNKPLQLDHRVVHPDGTHHIVHQNAEVTIDQFGRPVRLLGTVQNISQLKKTEFELKLADSMFNYSQEGIVITDNKRNILRINPAFSRILGYKDNEIIGLSADMLISTLHHDAIFLNKLWETIRTCGQWQGEIWQKRKLGKLFPTWCNIVIVKNDLNRINQFIISFTDITEEKLAQRRIRFFAHYDVLTNLPNRNLFYNRLYNSVELARRSHSKFALLFLDLDRFKTINDTLGHQSGDILLQRIAYRLKKSVYDHDLIARLGGDEFTIIVQTSNVNEILEISGNILHNISKTISLKGHKLVLEGSIGISVYPDDGKDSETLIKNADTAMYRAKEQGGNRYLFYTQELSISTSGRFFLENGLRQAVENNELVLHYQPQALLKNDTIVAAEALLRWNHRDMGMVYPKDFLPLAEEIGLIDSLGEWVLRTACKQAQTWVKKGLPNIRVAVNLSSYQILNGSIVNTVESILKETKLQPQFLELEISEGFVMENPDQGIAVLDGLRLLGVSLAIDDFGTGYSSLSHLRRLPINRLKVDRTFMQEIPNDKDGVAIVSAIIAMAHTLGICVVAEGVEKHEHLDFLRQHNCDEIQGYYLSKPLPNQEFETLVSIISDAGFKNWIQNNSLPL